MIIKELLISFRNDLKSIKIGLLIFCTISLVINIIPRITILNYKSIETDIETFTLFIFNFLIGLIQFYLIINFQRYYSKKVQIKCGYSKISTVFYQNIKIAISQFIIMILLLIIFTIIMFLLTKFLGDTSIVRSLLLFLGITGVVFWFYTRLLFVLNILVYKRDTYSTKGILSENSMLLKRYFLLMSFVFFCFLVYILVILISNKYPSFPVINKTLSEIIGALLGLVSQLILLSIVVFEKKKEEEKNQLTTAST